MAARGAATERLRRSLQQQAAREAEEEEEEQEKQQDEVWLAGNEAPSDNRRPSAIINPAGTHRDHSPQSSNVRPDDGLLYECDEREAEAQRHHAVAAEARAAALEAELAVTQQRLEEARLAAASAQRQAERAEKLSHGHGAGAGGADMASATRAQRLAEVDTQQLCVVCLERDRTHLLLPCGHKCLCGSCAARYDAHMCFEEASGDVTECVGTAPNALQKGKLSAQGGWAHKQKPKGMPRTPSQGNSRHEASSTHHACPLCRGRVTGVFQVWD